MAVRRPTPRPFGIGILWKIFSRLQDRDPETALHCLRVAASARQICGELDMPPSETAAVCMAALFHDIGKTAVSERILQKSGMLTGEEFESVKRHTEMTRKILGGVDWPKDFRRVPEIAACHHERWDGSGYPSGLAGDRIPCGARVIALADYFDALTSRRRYREPISPPAARRLVAARRGTHFDPSVTDAFFRRLRRRDLHRASAGRLRRPACGPSDSFLTRTGTCGGPYRFPEDPRRCRGTGSSRCR